MSGRRLLRAVVGGVTLLGVAACSEQVELREKRRPAAPSSPSPVGPRPVGSTPVSPMTYRAPAEPCDAVDTSALEAVTGKPVESRASASGAGVANSVVCSIRYRAHGVIVHLDLFEDMSAQPMYEGMRRVQVGRTPVREVRDVGAAAYSFDDPDTGPHVVAYEGNLQLSVSLQSFGAAAPGDVPTRLAGVARGTLARLRR